MKTESVAYAAERVKKQTHPVYFVRFFHVSTYGDGIDHPFSRDFATAAVQTPSIPKLSTLLTPSGNVQTIEHETGRSSVGTFTLRFVDRDGEMTKYLSAPDLTLKTAMTAIAPVAGGYVEFNEDPSGLPTVGTLDVWTGGVLERIRYDLVDVAGKRVRISARGGVDGTAAALHDVGDAATNGEQIRPGNRAQLYCGYAELSEADYLPFMKMEVTGRGTLSDGVTYEINLYDIQRALRRVIFLEATSDVPVLLTGNPINIALQLLTSTGTGTNGAYDVLPAVNGLGIPVAMIDVAGLEALRDAEYAGETYDFSITEPAQGKAFIEEELWATMNAYPVVRQDGKIGARRYKQTGSPLSVTLDRSTICDLQWRITDQNIINVIEFHYDWNLDDAKGIYSKRQTYTQVVSKNKYGRRPSMVIKSKGLKTAIGAQPILDARAWEVMKRFAEPAVALVVSTFYRHHVLEAGDIVRLTHPDVPNPRTGQRGFTDEPVQILDISPNFATGQVRLTLLWVNGMPLVDAPEGDGAFQTPDQRSDTVAPATPTGLTVTPTSQILNDGTFIGILDCTWNANAEPDLSHYVLRYRKKTTTPWDTRYGIRSDHRVVVRGLDPNTTFEVQVQAIDFANNASAFCATVEGTTPSDPGAPAVPSGLTTETFPLAVSVTWSANSEPDTVLYELLRADDSGFTTNVKSWLIGGIGFVDRVGDTTTRYYKLRAIRRTQVMSGWTSAVTGAGSHVGENNLADLAVTSAKIASLAVNTAKINDLAVSSIKLSDHAVTTLKMALNSVTTSAINNADGPTSIGSVNGTDYDLVSLAFTLSSADSRAMIWTWSWARNLDAVDGNVTYKLWRGAANIQTIGAFLLAMGLTSIVSFLFQDSPGAGGYTYKMTGAADATCSAYYNRIWILECKR